MARYTMEIYVRTKPIWFGSRQVLELTEGQKIELKLKIEYALQGKVESLDFRSLTGSLVLAPVKYEGIWKIVLTSPVSESTVKSAVPAAIVDYYGKRGIGIEDSRVSSFSAQDVVSEIVTGVLGRRELALAIGGFGSGFTLGIVVFGVFRFLKR
jgi:hypothetical protein